MDKREVERIRKFWNKPPAPTFCSACKRKIKIPPLGTVAGCMGDTFAMAACEHCGSRAGWTSTFRTGGRDAKADINALLAALTATE